MYTLEEKAAAYARLHVDNNGLKSNKPDTEAAIEDYMAGYVAGAQITTTKLRKVQQVVAMAEAVANGHSEFYSLSTIKYIKELLK